MGTNYYSVKRGFEHLEPGDFWDRMREALEDPENNDILHIGKSSGGWCFSLHIIPEMSINDLYDWIPFLTDPDRLIINEYSDVLSLSEMMDIITKRSRSEPARWTQEEYKRNYAEPGPNNLARHTVGRACAKQGLGTWDCIEGNFS